MLNIISVPESRVWIPIHRCHSTTISKVFRTRKVGTLIHRALVKPVIDNVVDSEQNNFHSTKQPKDLANLELRRGWMIPNFSRRQGVMVCDNDWEVLDFLNLISL